MIVNITTSSSSAPFQPPPLIDLPKNLPNEVNYKPYLSDKPYLSELIHRNGKYYFDEWYRERSAGYQQGAERFFANYKAGRAPSNQRELEVFQKYLDFLKKAVLQYSDQALSYCRNNKERAHVYFIKGCAHAYTNDGNINITEAARYFSMSARLGFPGAIAFCREVGIFY